MNIRDLIIKDLVAITLEKFKRDNISVSEHETGITIELEGEVFKLSYSNLEYLAQFDKKEIIRELRIIFWRDNITVSKAKKLKEILIARNFEPDTPRTNQKLPDAETLALQFARMNDEDLYNLFKSKFANFSQPYA